VGGAEVNQSTQWWMDRSGAIAPVAVIPCFHDRYAITADCALTSLAASRILIYGADLSFSLRALDKCS